MRELEIRGWERYGGGRTEGGRKGARGKGVQVKGVRKVKLGEEVGQAKRRGCGS